MRTGLWTGVALFCCLIVAGLTGVALADDSVSHTGSAAGVERTQTLAAGETTQLADRTVRLTQELRLTPAEPGEFDVRHRYQIPDGVTQLTVTLPQRATVSDQSGFVQRDGSYVWDGATTTPTLTYRMPANRTTDRDDPIAASGDYLFVDVGEWALVSRPQAGHSWSWQGGGRVGFEQAATVQGDGRVSDAIAFLGTHQTYTRTAHGQTFELVVPEAATLAEDRAAVFDSMTSASDSLRVGDRDQRVFVVAAPTTQVQWGVRGLQTGPADVWVRDGERLGTPSNVWLHEYVHTRQGYTTADSAQWFTEGTAVYYAALLSLEQGRIDFDAFQRRLALGTDGRFDGVVLSDRSTAQFDADYYVGALVAAKLDRQTRLATDRERSLQTAFSRLNERGTPVDGDQFEASLGASSTADVESLGRRYTRSTDRPSMWGQRDHDAAFDPTPARFSYRLASDDPDAVRVRGGYRNRSIGDTSPLVLVPGETLALNATVANDGGTTGDYDAAFRVDGTVEERQQGRLGPGERATLTFAHRFGDTGEHTVSVGDTTVPVSVREPAAGTVAAFATNRTRVAPGDGITLTATVENTAPTPARLTVPVTSNGRQIDVRTVRLDAGGQRTLTVERRLDDPGRYVFGLGNASTATVAVDVRAQRAGGRSPWASVAVGLVLALALGAAGVHLSGKP